MDLYHQWQARKLEEKRARGRINKARERKRKQLNPITHTYSVNTIIDPSPSTSANQRFPSTPLKRPKICRARTQLKYQIWEM